jgi:nucleoside-triphosphatase
MVSTDDVPKIGITGLPNVGKTSTLIKIVKKLESEDFHVGGMITEPVSEDGKRVGVRVKDWRTGEGEVFSHLKFESKQKVETDEGVYHVKTDVLEAIGVKALKEALQDPSVDILIIDEVGKMEMHSEAFCDTVKEALDSEKPVLMTLHKKSRNPLLQDIRRRDDVRILEVTPVNKNLLPYKIEKVLKDKLEKYYF